ncbi:MAG: hypothetical protein IKI11_07965 [Neisseriaceae bacterium]|nr:hypothetical protein [Neisseriaceae bacterium]
MAGKKCPECGKQTLFQNKNEIKCSTCGSTATIPPNEGKGGRGKQCFNCEKYKVFNGTCHECGTVHTYRDSE